jgi:hypothetical protein
MEVGAGSWAAILSLAYRPGVSNRRHRSRSASRQAIVLILRHPRDKHRTYRAQGGACSLRLPTRASPPHGQLFNWLEAS